MMLPYLADGPWCYAIPRRHQRQVLFPEGAPDMPRRSVRTVTIWSEDSHASSTIRVRQRVSLLYIANHGGILLHVWSSRVETLEAADWCILTSIRGCSVSGRVTVAKAVQRCRRHRPATGIKTSGSTGLHVLSRWAPVHVRAIPHARGTARAGHRGELPEIATVTRQVQKRGGKVYLDYVQNGHGPLVGRAVSARPLPGAPGVDAAR